jgi:hypothetical protein
MPQKQRKSRFYPPDFTYLYSRHMLLFKIGLTLTVVLSILWLTQRFGERAGALASGFPNSASLILLFYGLSYGTGFVEQTLPYAFLGTAIVIVAMSSWYAVSHLISNPWLGALAATISFIALSYFAQFIPLSAELGFIAALLAIATGHLLMRPQPSIDMTMHKATRFELNFRVMFIVGLVLVISETAQYLPIAMAGFFVLYPVNLTPLLFFLQRAHGAAPVQNILAHWPIKALSALSFFSVITVLIPQVPFLAAWTLAIVVAIGVTAIIIRFKL